MANNPQHPEYSEIFPVGARVRAESAWQPGTWEYGTVEGHGLTPGHHAWAIIIRLDDGTQLDYDYRFLDVDPRNSCVKVVK